MIAKALIKFVEREGWYQVRQSGSHRIFKHPVKTNTLVIPDHGGKDIPTGTFKAILKQAGLK